MRLNGKVVIVTGGAGGIGRATVRKLVAEGARVVVADLALDQAQAVVDEVGADAAIAERVDVSVFAEVEALVARAVEAFGRLDVMFNNAGIAGGRPLLEHDPERDYFPMIRIDQDSVYFGILAAARQFVAQGSPGVIISTSSIYGESAAENAFAYGAAKAAVISFTRSAAYELGPHGIRAVAITPGRVNTPMIQRLGPELGSLFAEQQASGRLTEPEEIADTVAFLASDEASAINGTVVHVDDGYSVFKQRFAPPRFD
ncbi:SDR family NAD(P)-dependent oxidoreductase [Luethyella okanaganae]|uniref:SDR family NAD(P)-dependent oxidoreductase n=1 Tax=Luethyella okanaganae TaxID=69372 RepID=A0ABW1VFW7_9MICO